MSRRSRARRTRNPAARSRSAAPTGGKKRTAPPAGAAGEQAARYLDLFASQVATCARDSEEPVGALGQSVLSIAASTTAIVEIVRATPPASAALRAAVEQHCVAVLERVQRAVVALQFHDLLLQRLRHVCEGLTEVAATLRANRQPGPEVWHAVGERIRARYSLHEQLTLFDQHVTGVTTADAGLAEPRQDGSRRVEIF